MTIVGSPGFLASPVAGSLMNATEGSGRPPDDESDTINGSDGEQVADTKESAGSIVAVNVQDKTASSAIVVSQRWNPLVHVARMASLSVAAIRGIVNFFCELVSKSVAVSEIMDASRINRSGERFVSAFEDLLKRGEWEGAHKVILNLEAFADRRICLHLIRQIQDSFSGYVQGHPSANIPLNVLCAACALRGDFQYALPIFRELMRTMARADHPLEEEMVRHVNCAHLSLHFLAQHELRSRVEEKIVGENIIPSTGYVWVENLSRDGVMDAMLPYLRAGKLPPFMLSLALSGRWGTLEEWARICDVLIAQRDWEMLKFVLDCAWGEHRVFIAQHLLKEVDSNNVYRRVAFPEWLVELAKEYTYLNRTRKMG